MTFILHDKSLFSYYRIKPDFVCKKLLFFQEAMVRDLYMKHSSTSLPFIFSYCGDINIHCPANKVVNDSAFMCFVTELVIICVSYESVSMCI